MSSEKTGEKMMYVEIAVLAFLAYGAYTSGFTKTAVAMLGMAAFLAVQGGSMPLPSGGLKTCDELGNKRCVNGTCMNGCCGSSVQIGGTTINYPYAACKDSNGKFSQSDLSGYCPQGTQKIELDFGGGCQSTVVTNTANQDSICDPALITDSTVLNQNAPACQPYKKGTCSPNNGCYCLIQTEWQDPVLNNECKSWSEYSLSKNNAPCAGYQVFVTSDKPQFNEQQLKWNFTNGLYAYAKALNTVANNQEANSYPTHIKTAIAIWQGSPVMPSKKANAGNAVIFVEKWDKGVIVWADPYDSAEGNETFSTAVMNLMTNNTHFDLDYPFYWLDAKLALQGEVGFMAMLPSANPKNITLQMTYPVAWPRYACMDIDGNFHGQSLLDGTCLSNDPGVNLTPVPIDYSSFYAGDKNKCKSVPNINGAALNKCMKANLKQGTVSYPDVGCLNSSGIMTAPPCKDSDTMQYLWYPLTDGSTCSSQYNPGVKNQAAAWNSQNQTGVVSGDTNKGGLP